MPVDALPWFYDAHIDALRDGCEQIMADHGWEKVIPVIGPEAVRAPRSTTSNREKIFTLSDDEKVPLADLEEDFR